MRIPNALALFLAAATLSPLALPDLASASPTQRSDPGSNTCRILTHENSGWGSPGNRLFLQNCKNCHSRDSGKNAPFLHAESFTMSGWNRIFFKKYPKCAQDGSWATLSPEQLLQVNDYLFRNAADSYDPYKARDCG